MAERQYRDLVELSLYGIVLHKAGQIAYANRAALRLLGARSVDEIRGRCIDDFIDAPYLVTLRDELIEPGSVRTPFTERRLTRLDGGKTHVELSAVPFVFENEPSVQLVVRDISERVSARASLLWTEAQFRALADQMPFVMWTADGEGRVVSVVGDASSPFAARALAAAEAHEPLPLDRPASRGADPDPHEAETFDVTVGDRSYALRLEPLRDGPGGSPGQVGVAFDVTPWLRMQELLREALRVDAIGQLAGGVAHEINNVLAIIGIQAELLMEPRASVREGVARILTATERAADVTRNLLSFAMRDVFRPAPMSVNGLVRDVIDTIRRTTHAGVDIDLRLTPGVPEVTGDATALSRALLNVCLNALDAMPGSGRLTVETATVAASGSEAGHPPRVVIRISDTGVGMSADVRQRAFEPFFSATTAKRVGLGLSMAQGVVQQHKGVIRLESELGAGTTITIELPAIPPADIAKPGPETGLADVSGRPKALVVDDEPMLRRVSGLMLQGLGYEVVEAADGTEGVERFRASPDEFAFVLLDVLMPGISGVDALALMLATDSDARVILCTGYPRDELGHEVFSWGTVEYLGKPYTYDALKQLIERVTGKTTS